MNKTSANSSLGIRGYDFIEFYVGSAKMATYWHCKAFGFKVVGYKGPETGHRDRISYYLELNDVKILLTSALHPETFDISTFVTMHGDGVKRWAMEVDNVCSIFDFAFSNGAVPVTLPYKLSNENGFVEFASIKLYDDAEIVFVNRDNYSGIFQPGFDRPLQDIVISKEETGINFVDHIVGNVRENEMNFWADYLNTSLKFETMLYFGPGDISTQFSALLSKVVRSEGSYIKNPINEPYEGKKKSQIEEFIDQYHGTGIQHIALATDDIVYTISALRKNGVEFLKVPDSYYDVLREKGNDITESIDDLQKNGILCDLEGGGYLLQLFTKPIGNRPTFFYEIIQRRKGAKGFGQGNFQALFESIEHDQALRGNLERD